MLLLLLTIVLLTVRGHVNLNIDRITGEFTISVDGEAWVTGGDIRVTSEGKTLSSVQGTLTSVNSNIHEHYGQDSRGVYDLTEITWAAIGTDAVLMETIFKDYGNGVIGFVQRFPNGLIDSSMGDKESVLSSFPSFKLPSTCTTGYYTWSGPFLARARAGLFCSSVNPSELPGGLQGGPLALYTQDQSIASMFSPASDFMTLSSFTSIDTKEIWNGVLGSIKSIPIGHEVEYIMVIGSGTNAVVSKWGSMLRTQYSNSRPLSSSDPTLGYLGYSTDFGAYYYKQTMPGLNYEDTMITVRKSTSIPYKYTLLDSWWYHLGINGSVRDWSPRPDVFPSGLEYLRETTSWVFQAHNKFWGADNVYAKENGGDYEFIMENTLALPNERRFWDDFFLNASQWGMVTYEQDWLHRQYGWMNATLETVDVSRNWLRKMGDAALAAGIGIQYCMAHPRQILQSLEIPAVTQVRASGDYGSVHNMTTFKNTLNWDIGPSSVLLLALGLAPSKDTAWSTSIQTGARKNMSEPFPYLQSAVLALSKGPVAFSDKVGHTDEGLILKTCAMDGKLLQASVPMRAIDAEFTHKAFGTGGASGAVWASYSDIGLYRFHHVFASYMTQPYALNQCDLFMKEQSDTLYSYTFDQLSGKVTHLARFTNDALELSAIGLGTFQLYHFSPLLLGRWIVLGEASKWVPTSPSRITGIDADQQGVTLRIRGSLGEVVTFAFANEYEEVGYVTCTMSSGNMIIFYPSGICDTSELMIK